ncbi:MAG: hypothetical protein H5T50_07625, partial [Nitrososphaeria archaeon]|nr:hypothetical protein [Nitrososphaeria archaeon]
MAKNVGIIHYTAPSGEVGGVENVISAHINFLSRMRFKVILIYGTGGGYNGKGVKEHQIQLLSPKNPKVVDVQKEVLEKCKATESFDRLKKMIKSELKGCIEGVDVCIVH